MQNQGQDFKVCDVPDAPTHSGGDPDEPHGVRPGLVFGACIPSIYAEGIHVVQIEPAGKKGYRPLFRVMIKAPKSAGSKKWRVVQVATLCSDLEARIIVLDPDRPIDALDEVIKELDTMELPAIRDE